MAKGDYRGYAERAGYVGGAIGAERRAAFVALAERQELSMRGALAQLIDRALKEDAIPETQNGGHEEH